MSKLYELHKKLHSCELLQKEIDGRNKDMSDKEVKEENLYNDLDAALFRANKLLDYKVDLPREFDTLEGALAKIIMIMNALGDKLDELENKPKSKIIV